MSGRQRKTVVTKRDGSVRETEKENGDREM